MGLGSTAKTLQRVADMGEELYSRLNEVRAQLKQLRDTVEETNDHVASLESEIEEQRAILEALAEQQGVDVDSVIAEIHIDEAETDEQQQRDDIAGDSEGSENASDESEDASESDDPEASQTGSEKSETDET